MVLRYNRSVVRSASWISHRLEVDHNQPKGWWRCAVSIRGAGSRTFHNLLKDLHALPVAPDASCSLSWIVCWGIWHIGPYNDGK